MDIDDFIRRMATEPERVATQSVMTAAPTVLKRMAKGGGLKLSDLLSAPVRSEKREVRYRHILGPPASTEAIDVWCRLHPAHSMPHDLRLLLQRANGIHLWANTETGRAYVGLAPIEEWDLARIKMYGPSADTKLLSDRYIAITYHQDAAAFVVFDVESRRYFLMDAAGPDQTVPIANSADELLDWLWQNRIAPEDIRAKIG